MKKIIVLLFALTIIYISKSEEEIIIPTNSIRYRIIANSDSTKDQMLKMNIKEKLDEEILPILSDSNSIEDSRLLIKDNLDNIKNIVSKFTDDFDVNYGKNYFPEKTYKGINYDAGNYESLVIKLGSGIGDNWWCVMFPPICSLEVEENSDIEYKFFVKELFDKYI